MLIGRLVDTGANDINVFSCANFISPGEILLGIIPSDFIFEELKCVVTTPAPPGTTFKLVDQNDNIIIPSGRIIVDRAISSSVNVNKKFSLQSEITGVFEGPGAASGAEIIFIKKIWRVE